MRILTFDLETTGWPPEARVVEIGWCEQTVATFSGDTTCTLEGPYTYLVDPGIPITPEAAAVHHITDEDVAGSLSFDEALASVLGQAKPQAICAHHMNFEREFVPAHLLEFPWICTYKCAKQAWPDAPSHALQVLRYWLRLDLNRDKAALAHRAGPDAYVTGALLRRLLQNYPLETLLEWTKAPERIYRLPFGKHKGELFSAVPFDYLEWLVFKADEISDDVRIAASAEMERRRKEVGNA